jgi:hypothetical protein
MALHCRLMPQQTVFFEGHTRVGVGSMRAYLVHAFWVSILALELFDCCWH